MYSTEFQGGIPQNVRISTNVSTLLPASLFPRVPLWTFSIWNIWWGLAGKRLPSLLLLWACPRDFPQSSEFLGVERAMITMGANHRARRLGSWGSLLPTHLSHSANEQSEVWSVNASQAPISPVSWSALCPVILAKYLGSFFFFFNYCSIVD